MEPYVEDWVAEFAATADRSPDAMFLRGSDGHVAYANSSGLALLGAADIGELDADADFVFGVVGDEWEPATAALDRGGNWTGDTALGHVRSGEHIPVWVSAFVVTGRHARTALVAVVCRDLRSRFDREQRLLEAAEDAAAHAREQRAVADLGRIALTASPFQVLAGTTETALTLAGMKCAVVVQPGLPDRAELFAVSYAGPDSAPEPIRFSHDSLVGLALSRNQSVVCTDRNTETRFSTEFMSARGIRSGAAIVIEGRGAPWGVLAVYSAEPRHFEDGELAFLQTVAGVLSAAIRRDELENELRRRTMHDPLTGLPNRVLARQRIEDVRTHGNPCAISVLVIDLDNFKMINDTMGHAVGDRALQAVAHVLDGAAAEGDTVSRFGGDEFVVLHRGPNPEELARRILHDLDARFYIDGYGITVSASIGVAVDEQFTADPDDLLRRADIAMYTAKNRGTSGFAVYGEPELARSGLGRHVQHDLEFEQ